jgi:hypothetical protein
LKAHELTAAVDVDAKIAVVAEKSHVSDIHFMTVIMKVMMHDNSDFDSTTPFFLPHISVWIAPNQMS